MRITPWLRYFFSGRTQAGKSTALKKSLPQIRNYVVYDCVKREFGQYGMVVHDLNAARAAVRSGQTRIIYQPYDPSVETFDACCKWIFEELRNVTFVVDEVHLWVTKSVIPPYFMKVVTVGQGEEFRIGVFAASQRPAKVHNDLLGNTTVFVAFGAAILRDAQAIEENTGIPAEELLKLPDRHFYVMDPREDPRVRRYLPFA